MEYPVLEEENKKVRQLNVSWSEKSKWIWLVQEQEADTYGDFFTGFEYECGKVYFQISVDSNYVLYINGEFVESGQYADFPHYKVYDRLDITKYCKQGYNQIAITVWYYGIVGSQTYYAGNAALRFEIYNNEVLCAYSNEKTLSRQSKNYQNGLKKIITPQMGLSFHYDARIVEDWKTGNLNGFTESVIVDQMLSLHERPVKKLIVGERIETVLVKRGHNYWLYDLGCEEVGYLTLRIKSEKPQKIVIGYGEHIVDGKVRRIIDGRDFSVSLDAGIGVTEYTNYFRRLGLRYLEVHSEYDLEIDYVSVLRCSYPINRLKKRFESELRQQIYDTAVRTLELCMHEHYEDCPWREQALYAMDSRNQILCGYYAFKEYLFPRANLYLMSQSLREDGLLAICAPSDLDLTIPSFSLHYFTEIYEYTIYSGDKTLAKEVLPVLQSIITTFLERMKDGLVPKFEGKSYWNFYEWAEDLEGGEHDNAGADAALNCLLSIALDHLQKICDLLEVQADYGTIAESLNKRIREVFYRTDTTLYVNRCVEEKYSELVNSLAVLCGAAKGQEAKRICEILAGNHELTKTSLSMVCFKYDALLKTDKEKYRFFVLHDIEKKYKVMLDAGATSFWETELGEADFCGAASLCHGWSAMPVYYFNILEMKGVNYEM